MATIRYLVKTMPQYEGWDAPHAPGEFLFDFKAVVECYRRSVQLELPYVHMHSRRDGRYRTYLEDLETLAWLERKWLSYYQNETEEVVSWPEHLRDPWLSCSSLILAKEFVSVACPSCEVKFPPDQIEVIEFQSGEGLCVHGGRGVVCAKGHGLYVISEWNT